jgi:proline dehydrogenase
MVHFDMEQYKYKDLTLAILKDLLMEPEFRAARRYRRHHAGLSARQL